MKISSSKLKNLIISKIHNTKIFKKYLPKNLKDVLSICPKCSTKTTKTKLTKNLFVCPKCNFHFKISAYQRLKIVLDSNSFKELNSNLIGNNPINFPEYNEKIKHLQDSTGLNEAVLTGTGEINSFKIVIAILDSRFLMGSMGAAVGEKITRAIEYATSNKLPLIIFSASGGARMQEGIFSLMQMAKTSASIQQHKQAKNLYISFLTNPTTGGVTASFASLGDIILAEPHALIGFAGPRVIEQTINQKLPEGFQTSEYLLEHGFLDNIVERKNLKTVLANLLSIHAFQSKEKMKREIFSKTSPFKVNSSNNKYSENKPDKILSTFNWNNLTPANKVYLARHFERPRAKEYIDALFTNFFPLYGDRLSKEDKSILGGIALYKGIPVTVVAQRRGKTLEENIAYNFGMTNPEGYRKIQRLAKEAEKFNRPIITFIDTPGAYPGIEAEQKGQGEAIASCLAMFSQLRVPVIAIVIGEGGSGGALAISVANTVIILGNAVYSILSPEGFAAILWKDASRSEEASRLMKITAQDLYEYGIVDHIIKEGVGAAQENKEMIFGELDQILTNELIRLKKLSGEELSALRYQKFRKIGGFYENDNKENK